MGEGYLVDPTIEEKSKSATAICVAYAANLKKIMHVTMSGTMDRVRIQNAK